MIIFVRMKRYIFFFVMLLSVAANARSYRAYLYIIGSYPTTSEWWSIHATNDAALLTPVLLKQGFKVEELRNAMATKKNIIASFRRIIATTRPGDVILIHFSSHGQQMEDDNGDEADGWDEAMIPYDAAMTYRKKVYWGQNHLRDDEFNRYLIQIRRKAGPTGMVIVTLDACHSTSATRHDEKEDICVRGTAIPFTSKPLKAADLSKMKQGYHYTDTPLLKAKNLAPLTVVSACKSYQSNTEVLMGGIICGPLSYCLSSVWNTGISISEPQRWCSLVLNRMSKITKQNPAVETTMSFLNHGSK
jgi:hypothetical protein